MTTPQGIYGLYDWRNLPAPVTVGASGTNASRQLTTGAGLIIALCLQNDNATTACRGLLLDGTDNTGYLITPFGAAAGGNSNTGFPLPGLPFRIGLYARNISGLYDLAVTYIPLIQPLW